jgi:beta-lactamase regulating signal transducer with metallopeptidase domain
MDINALLSTFNAVSDRAADIAVAALWQGALVASALVLCLRMAPRVSAAYRFALWATAFVSLVGLSVFSLIPQFSAGATGAMAARISENVARPWLNVDARWSVAIAVLWLAASLFRAVDLAVHSLRLRKLWKDATPVLLDERVEALLTAASADCGRGPVEVCTTKTLQRPSVIGFFKPRILIPDWLFGRLTQGELEQIVLHEAEHLRRRDDWTNLAQKLCLVLFPLNPALIWIERRLCREREMACDDGVIRVTRAPRAYAACLASLAERGLERQVEALSLGAWQRRPELVHRVHSILRSKGGLSPMSARVLLGTLGCGLIAGSVELAQSPRLVAFVPARSAMANAIKNSDAAKAVTERPVQAASLKSQKPLHNIHAVPSKTSAVGNSSTDVPGAMNVTLREPDGSRNMVVPVVARAARGDAANADSKNQQWIVLTEWQQVETSGDNAGLRRDYDADAQNDDLPPSADQGSRITVTQLIFRIMPAHAGLPANTGLPANAELPATAGTPANAGSKFTTKPAASSSKSQPGFATFRDGWLVLQL